MAKFPLYQWKKAGEGSSSIDTQNFASKIKANTFTQKNTFKNTGDVVSIQRTDNSSFGIDLLTEQNDRIGYFGTRQNSANETTVWGKNGLLLQSTSGKVWVGTSGNDFQWESTRNWNQNVDNTLVRTKDLNYVRKWEYTSLQNLPAENWNTTNWKWTMNGINTEGIHEFVIVITTQDNTSFTFNPKIIWKSGMTVSNSPKFILDKLEGGVIEFVFTIKSNNQFHINHKKVSGNIALSWARCWVIRNNNLPWKVNQLW